MAIAPSEPIIAWRTPVLTPPAPDASLILAAPVQAAPKVAPTTRHKLFAGLIAAGCELIAVAATAAVALVASRESDALADAHVARIDRLAQRIARDAARGTLTPERAMGYALLIRRNCDDYHRDDGQEDSWIEKAHAALQRLIGICRGMNRSLDRELAKRGVGTGGIA